MAKLYAKITNENGKTAQKSGDEYLDIDVMVGNIRLASFTLRHTDDLPELGTSGWGLYDEEDEIVYWLEDDVPKGKKRQGEMTATDVINLKLGLLPDELPPIEE